MSNYKRLYRIPEGRVLAGVCSGIGEYFGVDPVVVRLAWLLFAFMWGSGLLAYLVAWIIVPERPSGERSRVNYE